MSGAKVFIVGVDEIPRRWTLSEGESLEATFVIFPGTDCKLDVEVDINGRDCRIDLAGLYLCTGNEQVDIQVNLRHNVCCGESRQLFKGIAGGSSRTSFSGLVYVARDAVKVKASQENHTILLSAGARAETKPQLEIYADDVECSHGATTGFLSEDEQFYMRSRGIPESEARKLQLISFLSEVAERLPEDLKEKVYDSIS